jgi:hypothetical protein
MTRSGLETMKSGDPMTGSRSRSKRGGSAMPSLNVNGRRVKREGPERPRRGGSRRYDFTYFIADNQYLDSTLTPSFSISASRGALCRPMRSVARSLRSAAGCGMPRAGASEVRRFGVGGMRSPSGRARAGFRAAHGGETE